MAQINILLDTGLRCLRFSMRGPEDGNEDGQESLNCFLVYKTFNHLVIFI